MCLSSPKAPPPPPKLPEAARAPEAPVQQKESKTGGRKRTGRQSTIVTGSQGLTDPASTTRKTLLGG